MERSGEGELGAQEENAKRLKKSPESQRQISELEGCKRQPALSRGTGLELMLPVGITFGSGSLRSVNKQDPNHEKSRT